MRRSTIVRKGSSRPHAGYRGPDRRPSPSRLPGSARRATRDHLHPDPGGRRLQPPPRLVHHRRVFHGMWSNHPRGEDAPGQRVLWARSDDAEQWSPAAELFPRPCAAGSRCETGFKRCDGTGLADHRDDEFRTPVGEGRARLGREVFPDVTRGPVFVISGQAPGALRLTCRLTRSWRMSWLRGSRIRSAGLHGTSSRSGTRTACSATTCASRRTSLIRPASQRR